MRRSAPADHYEVSFTIEIVEKTVQINLRPDPSELLGYFHLQSAAWVKRYIDNAAHIGGELHTVAVQATYAESPEASLKVTELKNHILTGSCSEVV